MLGAKLPLAIFIVILETSVACSNTHEFNQNNELNKRSHRIAHAFALCQIIWFVHRFVNDAIISTIFFVIAPAHTLGIISFLVFTIGGAIVFVAITIHKGIKFTNCHDHECKKTLKYIFWATLNGIIIFVLIFSTTLLYMYIVLIDNGLKSGGMGGLILSLIPPFAVFVFGFIVNQKYF